MRLANCLIVFLLLAFSVAPCLADKPAKIGPPPPGLKAKAFYKKYLDADGIPVLASATVDDYALREAAHLAKLMLAHRPDVRQAMAAGGSRILILAYNEYSTDLPEYAAFEPKDYWDARARGFGGSEEDPNCSCGEENLLGYPGDPYKAESIFIHEFAHNIHLRGLNRVDPAFDKRLQATYERAMKQGLWKGKYAAVNRYEYFAEGVQSWFDDNRPPDHDHNHVDTRVELQQYDPGLAKICAEVFGKTKLEYTKPATRLHGHLEGYDPAQAPAFHWPERLKKAQLEIAREVNVRTKNAQQRKRRQPNVLFIAVDDLNDWIGCLGGHPQTKTPHIDKLATEGMLFTNAYCAAASCNPSRSAIFTGIAPYRSGLYTNLQKMRQVMPQEAIMPKHFSKHGYWSAGGGKLLHYFVDGPSWDDYFPDKNRENPFPRTLYPPQRPVSIPREPWMYVETDWSPLDASDEEYGGDWLVAEWARKQFAREQERAFFLACGIYRPHEPWFVPKKYFEPFPVDEIVLPPGYRENDLDDLPPAGKRLGPNKYFEHIQEHKQWKPALQGYLASIHFADAMVGRILEGLRASEHWDDTIVVLWSDHGWHLGEKQHWQKFTGWRACARVPLIIRVPTGYSSLIKGTTGGSVCHRPVNLLDLFPTLTDLCGVPAKPGIDGRSLLPLLEDPQATWPHAAITHFGRPGNYAISGERWRYIHYQRGDEELYDIVADPYEWRNLANEPQWQKQLQQIRKKAPRDMQPKALP